MLCDGLYDWWHNRPPSVVFVLTLFACILTLVTLSVYVSVHRDTLPNPNVRDWNTFYGVLSTVDLCIPNDLNTNGSTSAVHRNESIAITDLNDTTVYSVVAGVALRGQGAALSELLRSQRLQLLLNENFFGKKLLATQDEWLHITLGFPDTSAVQQKPKRSAGSRIASVLDDSLHAADSPYRLASADPSAEFLQICVTVVGPSIIMPNSHVKPPSCRQFQSAPIIVVQALGGSVGPCNATDSVRRLTVQERLRLTPMLSEDETLMIELHLMYTTSALVLLVVILLGYAACRRVGSIVSVSAHKPLLLPSDMSN